MPTLCKGVQAARDKQSLEALGLRAEGLSWSQIARLYGRDRAAVRLSVKRAKGYWPKRKVFPIMSAQERVLRQREAVRKNKVGRYTHLLISRPHMERVLAYALEQGITKGDALRRLIGLGLDAAQQRQHYYSANGRTTHEPARPDPA